MKKLLLVVILVVPATTHAAVQLNSPLVDGAWPIAALPSHSWTYNVDFKDPDALAAFFGREVVDGQWKGGFRYDPLSVYRVSEAEGTATRWVRAGAMVVTNSERLNATFGPHIGLDIMEWKPRLSGAAKAGSSLWKPLGYFDLTATVDLWGGWTPVHTADVNHDYAGGFGFSLNSRFGGPRAASDAANAIIKAGL